MTHLDFYKISARIYKTFQNNNNKIVTKIYCSKYTQENIFPLFTKRLLNFDKNTIFVMCLYVNFKYYPRNLRKMYECMNNVTNKEISAFKLELNHSIKTYKGQLDTLKQNVDISLESLISLYSNKDINFITLYFKAQDFKYTSRLYEYLFCRINPMMLFIQKFL